MISEEKDINNKITNIMELVRIKINRFSEKLEGIKIHENEEWLFVVYNPVDYLFDGMLIINKQYINDI